MSKREWEHDMELVVLLGILIVLAIAAVLWGFDSRDSIDSEEWERRHEGGTTFSSHHQ